MVENLAVLLVGDYRQTLALSRSIKRLGYRVILATSSCYSLCSSSRNIDEIWRCSDIELNEGDFFSELAQLLQQRKDIQAIFPIGEDELRKFSRTNYVFPENIQIIQADKASIELCLDKSTLLAKAEQLSIPSSQSFRVSNYQQLFDAQQKLGFPGIIKPVGSDCIGLSSKAIILSDPDDLDYFKSWPTPGFSLLLQRYFSGRRHNLYFAADRGKIISLVEVKILTTDTDNDTGLAIHGTSVELTKSLRSYTEKLVNSLQYQGVGCVQYLYNEQTGECCFLELNPRVGANVAITEHCGVDFARLFIELSNPSDKIPREPQERQLDDYEKGVNYVWLSGELDGMIKALGSGQDSLSTCLKRLFGLIKLSFTFSHHIVWHASDPMPAVRELARLLKSLIGAIGRKLMRI